ncbi:MAG: YtxH domain-containing protein [Cytophagaceae bacterium]
MNENGKVLLGFFAGLAAGTITGILMAPDSGMNTRKNITDKVTQFRDSVNDQFQKGMDKFNTLKDSAFSLVNRYGEQTTKEPNM